MIYAGLTNYDYNTIEMLSDEERVDGIVIGDGFCNKKMLSHGTFDLPYYMNLLMRHGKNLIYQTPCFLTDKKLEEQLQLLDFLKDYEDSLVLVQDLGMASLIKEQYPYMRMGWSRLSKFRVDVYSSCFLDVLKKMNVLYVETDDFSKMEQLSSLNITPLFLYGKLSYGSFGRVCYYCYETDKSIFECERGCLKRQLTIKDEIFNKELSLDGYILGEHYPISVDGSADHRKKLKDIYLSDSPIGIYGKNVKDLKHKLNVLEEMLKL